MPTNKDEDKSLSKACRSAIARSPLDISELNIRSTGGYIDLEGKVRAPRGAAGHVAVRKEFENLITICRSVRGVKDASGSRVTVIEG